MRAGQRLPRTAGVPTPCWKCPKSEDKKTPCPEADISRRNLKALEVYYRIKAGMPMPPDPIVARNCGLIRWVEDAVERNLQSLPLLFMAGTAGASKGKK